MNEPTTRAEVYARMGEQLGYGRQLGTLLDVVYLGDGAHVGRVHDGCVLFTDDGVTARNPVFLGEREFRAAAAALESWGMTP